MLLHQVRPRLSAWRPMHFRVHQHWVSASKGLPVRPLTEMHHQHVRQTHNWVLQGRLLTIVREADQAGGRATHLESP